MTGTNIDFKAVSVWFASLKLVYVLGSIHTGLVGPDSIVVDYLKLVCL